jgi:hypothetical protein
MKINSLMLFLLSAICMLMLMACGGAKTAETQISEATVVPTVVPKVEVEPSPTRESSQPEPTKTPTPTEMPYADTPTPFPTTTFTPVPTATPPPIPTTTPTQAPPTPTPTPLVRHTIVDTFGFISTIDGEVNVESSGFAGDDPNISEGIIFFEYSGANSILVWFQDSDSDIDEVLADNYTSLVEAQPDLTFSLINEGNVPVGSYAGQYLTFITNTASGDSGGGVIGSWRCEPGTVFALTVTGSDAAVVQIRFKRLLDGFACGS